MKTYAELESRGVTVTREPFSRSSSISIGIGGADIPIASSHADGVRVELRLPSPSGLRAAFRREGLGTTIKKWFKAELQTGDETFDRAVYIDALSERAIVAELLRADEIRAAILLAVVAGGTVEIDSDRILWEGPGGEPDEAAVVALAELALLSASR